MQQIIYTWYLGRLSSNAEYQKRAAAIPAESQENPSKNNQASKKGDENAENKPETNQQGQQQAIQSGLQDMQSEKPNRKRLILLSTAWTAS